MKADDAPGADVAPAHGGATAPPAAVRTVKGYSVPGEGSSTLISIVTVVALFALWWVATHFGWIRDLFSPRRRRCSRASDRRGAATSRAASR